MIEVLLRVFGWAMLAGGGLSGALGLAESSRSFDAIGAAAAALQSRMDLVDAGLLVGGGLLCIGMAAVLGTTTTAWEQARDPYDDHPKMAREVSNAMRAPEIYDEA
jgi:hypothetical protein